MNLKIKPKCKNIFLAAILLTTPLISISNPAKAAVFTENEKALVNKLQTDYENLDKTAYSVQNLYQLPPNLIDPFNPGQVMPAYIAAQVAYINYYRSLFDLGGVITTEMDNQAAQTTAGVLAATNANPFVNQHGIPSLEKPDFINDQDWLTAKQVSSSSNLNFNTTNESAGDVITDFVRDNNNLTGADTGHRAWVLSSRLSHTGIGAAYGTNGYRYSVQTVVFGDDIFRAAEQSTIAYPSTGVFPIELLQGGNVPWSYYVSDQQINLTPVITIKDLDTGQVSTATNVGNYSNDKYGNFNTIITYYPGDIALVSGHEYSVNISGITQYNFKLYNQNRIYQPPYQESKPDPVIPDKPAEVVKNKLMLEAEKLRDSLNKNRALNTEIFGRSYQDGKNYHNLGTKQWFNLFYQYGNPEIQAGIVTLRDYNFNRQIYTAPYLNSQLATNSYVEKNHSYPYGQKIENGKYTWYYLGPHKWIKQKTVQVFN